MVETFLFDGPDESLGVGIKVQTSPWKFHRLHTRGFENAVELVRAERITITDQVPFAGRNRSPPVAL